MEVGCYNGAMDNEQLGLMLATATVCAALKATGHIAEADRYKFRLAQVLRAAGHDPDEVYDAMVRHMEDPRL